jgi:hypothetical protein
MEDLLGALLQGGQQPPEPDDEAPEDPLAQLLQGLMGGQAPQGTAGQQQAGAVPGGMDMGGLLQGLLGGTGGAGQAPQAFGGQAQASGPAQGGMDMGGLLQGLLGGGGGLAAGTGQAASTGQAVSSGGGLGSILGAIMGGGSPTLQTDSFLAPIVSGLAEKLGLPPQIAQAVVAFVIGKLLDHRMQPGRDMGLASTAPPAAQPQAMSLEDVVQRMNSGKSVTKTSIRNAGLAKELAEHTGLDRRTAEASLQEVLNALGGQLGVTE